MKHQTKRRKGVGVLTGLLFSVLSCTAVFGQSTAQINAPVKSQESAPCYPA